MQQEIKDNFRAESLSECLQKNIAFAVFRQPGEKIKRILINDVNQKKTSPESPMFIFYPYRQGKRYKKIILKGLYAEFEGTLEEGDIAGGLFGGKVKLTENNHYFTDAKEFCAQVAEATALLKTTSLKKVVLSRIRFKKLIPGFGFFRFYDEICTSLPDSHAYIFYHPECGLWCGASPELLLKYSDSMVETVSLAGTQNPESVAVNRTEWGDKEIIEQQLVTDYITDVFRRNGLKDIKISGPVTVRAGNVCHLKTFFSAKTKDGFLPLNFARVLHPTPAVCGLPQRQASQYIKRAEKHERGYYTGFMGILYPGGAADLYVNLRCLQVLEDGFALYAGAGITSDSDPEKEWVETGKKTETLLNILNHQKRP